MSTNSTTSVSGDQFTGCCAPSLSLSQAWLRAGWASPRRAAATGHPPGWCGPDQIQSVWFETDCYPAQAGSPHPAASHLLMDHVRSGEESPTPHPGGIHLDLGLGFPGGWRLIIEQALLGGTGEVAHADAKQPHPTAYIDFGE